jgi:hypothetical protein
LFDNLFGNNFAYALHLVASHGDVPQTHRLVDAGKDIYEIHVGGGDFDGSGTALPVAVWRKQPAVLEALLERSANTDIRDEGSLNIMEEYHFVLRCDLGAAI